MRNNHKLNIRWVEALLLVASGLACFWPGLSGWFVFDDYVNLVQRSQWQVTSLAAADWIRASSSDVSGAVGRPLAMVSFSVNYYFTGLDPFWLKFTNLALHVCNGLLVWLLCIRIFDLIPEKTRPGRLAAWLVAAAWLMHPLQASTVLYIVQRMEIGAATGILLALLFYMQARVRQIAGAVGWPYLLPAIAAVLFGLGFKESALLAPAFALILEALVFNFSHRDKKRSSGWMAVYAIGLLLAVSGWLVVVLPLLESSEHWALRDFGPGERMLTQLPVLLMYLKQILLPLPETLLFYYDNYPISTSFSTSPQALFAGAVHLTLLAAAAACRRRWSVTTLGIAWFFVAHSLTSNLWPLELAFEHRNYLALFGVVLALVQPMHWIGQRLTMEAKTLVACLPIVTLAALCMMQSATWGEPMRLAWTLENRNPASPRANYDLASQFLFAAADDPNSPFWTMAREQFERTALAPTPSPLALQGLLLMHGLAGLPSPAQYWDLLRISLTAKALHGERSGALHALTACQIQGRCSFDTQQMLDTFMAVIARNPDNPTALTLYANFAWNVLEDRPLALRMQREAVRLDPDDTAYRIALAKFLLASTHEDLMAEGKQTVETLKRKNDQGILDADLAELAILMHDIDRR